MIGTIGIDIIDAIIRVIVQTWPVVLWTVLGYVWMGLMLFPLGKPIPAEGTLHYRAFVVMTCIVYGYAAIGITLWGILHLRVVP